MSSFRNQVAASREFSRTPRTASRFGTLFPKFDLEKLQSLDEAVASLLRFGSTGVGSIMGPSGLQIRGGDGVAPDVETGFFAVMRAFGTGEGPLELDKQELFIQIQKLYPTTTTPWDHKWKIDLNESYEPASCMPGLRAEHYNQYLTTAEDFTNDIVMFHTPVLDIQMRSGVWVAFQGIKMDLSDDVGEFRITDCNKVPTL
jgi:hypothetical protein